MPSGERESPASDCIRADDALGQQRLQIAIQAVVELTPSTRLFARASNGVATATAALPGASNRPRRGQVLVGLRAEKALRSSGE